MSAPALRIDAPLHKLRRLQELRRKLADLNDADAEFYRGDIAAWARVRLGVVLWSRQVEIAQSVTTNRRTAVRSAAGIGKSFLAAVIALWWVDTHPKGEAIVITTAPTGELVQDILWGEIRQLHREGNLQGTVQRGMPVRWVLDDGTLVGLGRKPAEQNKAAFQGFHRKYVLVILDEAGGASEMLWAGAENVTTNEHCRVLAIGNPDDNSSKFAKVCQHSPLWAKFQVSAYDSPNLTGEDVPDELRLLLPSREHIEDLKIEWGETNPMFISKVLGEFADAADNLIPLSWIQAAQRRWTLWHEDYDGSHQPPGRNIFGVDVARFGEDKTAIANRQGHVVHSVQRWSKLDTVAVTGLVEARLDTHVQSTSVVDADGIGGAVVDLLRSHGRNVIAYSGAAATKKRDRTGTQRFFNCLTGDAQVRPIGELRRIYRAPYQGPLFEIETASGDHFTATPNHKVLTPQGWVAVQSLRLGDHLSDPSPIDPAGGVARLTEPVIDDVPPPLSEIYAAAARAFGTERVASSAVDFHGDRPAGEVDVVTIDRHLLSVDPADRQRREDIQLVRLLAAPCPLNSQGGATGPATVGHRRVDAVLPRDGMPTLRSKALSRGVMLDTEDVGFCLRSAGNPTRGERPLDSPLVDGQIQCDSPYRLAGQVAVGHGLVVQADRAAQRDGLLPASQRGFSLVQGSPDDAPFDAIRFAEGVQRSPCQIAAGDLIDGDRNERRKACSLHLATDLNATRKQYVLNAPPVGSEFAANRRKSVPAFVPRDEIVGIKFRPDASHGNSYVYTLETATGTYATRNAVHKNCRSAAWYNVRELLDPAFGSSLCLPPTTTDASGREDDMLAADLAAPKWPDTTGNIIQVEKKIDIMKRLGHSPDTGDAVVQSLWIDPAGRPQPEGQQRPRARSYADSVKW